MAVVSIFYNFLLISITQAYLNINKLCSCELWAKFYAPDRNWASTELQNQLHSQHKMLCSKHFESSMFYDKTKLVRHAVPNQSNCDIKVRYIC